MSKKQSQNGYWYEVPDEASDLIDIDDVGETAAIKLSNEGYSDLSDFTGMNPKDLASETGIKQFTAIRIISQADEKRFDPDVYKTNRGDQE